MAARQLRVRTPWESYKRQSIQDAVIRLICREGLKSVTMERVAQETGIAKGTVYLHYRDKQELLESVKESMFALMNQRLRSEKPAPVEDDANLIGDLFIHGLEKKKR